MKKINLSFIIPIYNAEAYIEFCIKSLLSQDTRKYGYEVICINDGSTDRSKEILMCYKEKFDNIYYYEQPNQGMSSARNLGLSKANGDYIMFKDADDELRENCVQELLNEVFLKKLDVLESNFY